MYRTLAVATLLLTAVPLCAADATPPDEPATPWYKRMFGSSKPKPAPHVEPAADKPPTWNEVSRSLEQERAIYMERLQFCTRLREIAAQSSDEELSRKADELEEQAEAVYMKRTNKLPSIVQEVKAAEATLEQKRPTPPTGSASAGRISGRSANGRPIISKDY